MSCFWSCWSIFNIRYYDSEIQQPSLCNFLDNDNTHTSKIDMGNNNSRHHLRKQSHQEFTLVNSSDTNRSLRLNTDEIHQQYRQIHQLQSSHSSSSSSTDSFSSIQPEKITSIIKEINKEASDPPGFSFNYNLECTFISETSCCICFEDYYDGMTMHMLPCDHIIHQPCLYDWYRRSKTCPMCRQEYPT